VRFPLILRNNLIPVPDRLGQPSGDMWFPRNGRNGLEICSDGKEDCAGPGEAAECLALRAEVQVGYCQASAVCCGPCWMKVEEWLLVCLLHCI
jgi:hypothetical protein